MLKNLKDRLNTLHEMEKIYKDSRMLIEINREEDSIIDRLYKINNELK